MVKSCRNCAPKASPRRSLYNFGKKALKKVTLFFLPNPAPFHGQDYKKQKGHRTVTNCFSGYYALQKNSFIRNVLPGQV